MPPSLSELDFLNSFSFLEIFIIFLSISYIFHTYSLTRRPRFHLFDQLSNKFSV